MKSPALLLLACLSACASLHFAPERRLADADRDFRVHKLLVLPLSLTAQGCPEEIDTRARNPDLEALITRTALDQLKTRGYRTVPVPTVSAMPPTAADISEKAVHDLQVALCTGRDLNALPPTVVALVARDGHSAGADQVLVGGVSRLRWHLKMSLGDEDNGAGGNDVSQFEVRAAAAIYDLAQRRVVWNERVETTLYTGNYRDAIERVLLFSELKHTDPHEKLFYDMPLPAGASAP